MRIIVTDSDGNTNKITERKPTEAALLQANKAKYHQTEGGSQLLLDKCIDLFGGYGEGDGDQSVLNGTMQYPAFLT